MSKRKLNQEEVERVKAIFWENKRYEIGQVFGIIVTTLFFIIMMVFLLLILGQGFNALFPNAYCSLSSNCSNQTIYVLGNWDYLFAQDVALGVIFLLIIIVVFGILFLLTYSIKKWIDSNIEKALEEVANER